MTLSTAPQSGMKATIFIVLNRPRINPGIALSKVSLSRKACG